MAGVCAVGGSISQWGPGPLHDLATHKQGFQCLVSSGGLILALTAMRGRKKQIWNKSNLQSMPACYRLCDVLARQRSGAGGRRHVLLQKCFGSPERQHGRPFLLECSLVAPEVPVGDEKGSLPCAQHPSPRPACPACRRVTP